MSNNQTIVPHTHKGDEYVVVQSYHLNYNQLAKNDNAVEFKGYTQTFDVQNNKAQLREQQLISGRLRPENLNSIFNTGFWQETTWKKKKQFK